MGNVKETPEPRLRQLIEKDKQQRIDKCVAMYNDFIKEVAALDCELQPSLTLAPSGAQWQINFVAK